MSETIEKERVPVIDPPKQDTVRRPARERIELTAAKATELPSVYAYLADRIDNVCEESFFLAACSTGLAVAWRFQSSAKGTSPGYLVTLPITPEGEGRLLSGQEIGRAPSPAFIARVPSEIAAIYVWALASDKGSFAGVLKLLDIYSANEMKALPIYCRPTTVRNAAMFEKIGFRSVSPDNSVGTPMVIHRNAPVPDAALINHLRTDVCRNLDDLHQVISIRSVSYMAEQDCPFEEEFDGNDLGATHMIGRLNGRAAACIRARYFGSFVKIERLAVLPEFRRGAVGVQLARAVIEFCRRKGFTQFYGHSADRVSPLWEQVGFRHVPDAEPFTFSGVTYREMCLNTQPHPEAVTMNSGPYVIIRPEGAWDRPGVLG